MVNSVFTLYELSNGDDTENEGIPWYTSHYISNIKYYTVYLYDLPGCDLLCVFTDLLYLSEFHGLEDWMLLRSLQALQADGKAEIISMDDGKGVKFFWIRFSQVRLWDGVLGFCQPSMTFCLSPLGILFGLYITLHC